MKRSSNLVISGWPAILLAPIAIPIAIIVQLLPFKKTVDRTPADVVGFLSDFLEGTGGEWDWDEFECVPITDPELEALRRRAANAAPPNANLTELHAVLADAREIAERRRHLNR